MVQPVVPLLDDDDVSNSHEVFIRMLDEQGRLLLPGSFISAAERNGIMPMLDRWVVREVLQRGTQLGDGMQQAYAINLSSLSLADLSFPQYVQETLARHKLPGSVLMFEFKEAALSKQGVAGGIAALHALGCKLGVDDLGNGSASLLALQRLPVDYFKIAPKFTDNSLGQDAWSFVKALISLGRLWDRRIIVTGLEQRDTVEAVRLMGVRYAQGYYFGRPQPWVS